jgi:hypothetical protein
MPDQPTPSDERDEDREIMEAAALLTLDALEQEDPENERADEDERRAYAWWFRVGTLMALDLISYALTTRSPFALDLDLTRDEEEVYDQLEEAVVTLQAARVRNEVEFNLGRILRDEENDDAE